MWECGIQLFENESLLMKQAVQMKRLCLNGPKCHRRISGTYLVAENRLNVI